MCGGEDRTNLGIYMCLVCVLGVCVCVVVVVILYESLRVG